MHEGHGRAPARAENGDERRRCDHHHPLTPWSRLAIRVPARGPSQKASSEHELGHVVVEHERSVGKLVDRCFMPKLPVRSLVDTLRVKLCVNRISSDLIRMKPAPDRDQAVVVLAPAERARAMPGRESRRLVEEEELREPAGLEQRCAPPPPELEPAGDPPLPAVPPPNAAVLVVQAAAVSVDETATADLRPAPRAASRGSATASSSVVSCGPSSSHDALRVSRWVFLGR